MSRISRFGAQLRRCCSHSCADGRNLFLLFCCSYSTIDARRTAADSHTLLDLTAFNTDGFDVSGKDIWIHDCEVWNQVGKLLVHNMQR